MKFNFYLAGRDDDPEIRKLLAESPMPGRVGVAFEREPDFFSGCSVTGHNQRVYIGRETDSGELAFLAVTANIPRYIEGKTKTIGYLGQLRVADKYQGCFIPLRAMEFLHEHEDYKGPDLFFSVVSKENITPRTIFAEHPRPLFPKSIQIGNLYTAGITVGRKRKDKKSPFTIHRGTPSLLDEVISFLNREGARKQLYPCYSREDFTEKGLTRGFKLEDMRIACRNGEIIGTVGFWDQSAYKQSVVTSYDRSLRILKPFYNTISTVISPFNGMHPLPKIGQPIISAYAAFICIRDDNLSVFRALLDTVYNLAVSRGKHHLLVGLAKNDPLLTVAKKYRHIAYYSSIHLFSLRRDISESTVREQVPYIEIASL